tara:strand:+ start:211 stop:411 length:201 start_codon:yes stop_codon:yes gene_type:complete
MLCFDPGLTVTGIVIFLAYSKPFPIKLVKDYFGTSAPRLGLCLEFLMGLIFFLTSSFSTFFIGELF